MVFDHNKAKKYELNSSKQWIDASYPSFIKEINEIKNFNTIKPHYLDLFFNYNLDVWNRFVRSVRTKNCMEISSGPCGVFPFWQNWIEGSKIIIDPLINAYYEEVSLKGQNWFDQSIVRCAVEAEEFLDEYNNKIDGFILFRNGLDHCSNPYLVLENIGKYAASGCMFLFWSDIWHLEPPDEGHRQITQDSEEFEKFILNGGFELVRRTPPVRPEGMTIEYGGVFIKK